jgi:pilus assembly protein CpaB
MLIGAFVAILAGLLASRYVYSQLKRAQQVKPVKVVKVVVAAVPMQLGARLQPQQLRLADWPEAAPLPGTFTRIEDCVGRALITSVVENEPILDQKLAPREAGAGLPAAIPQGFRAVAVRVDDVVDVAGFVAPGTMVDVLMTGDLEASAGSRNSVTRTILEDVRVLAAGQKVEQDKEGKPQTVSVVTLLVDPEQADKLAMASTEGKIHLALRNTIDTSEANPLPVYREALLVGFTPAPKAVGRRVEKVKPAADPTIAVEVIRGEKRETQQFPEQ